MLHLAVSCKQGTYTFNLCSLKRHARPAAPLPASSTWLKCQTPPSFPFLPSPPPPLPWLRLHKIAPNNQKIFHSFTANQARTPFPLAWSLSASMTLPLLATGLWTAKSLNSRCASGTGPSHGSKDSSKKDSTSMTGTSSRPSSWRPTSPSTPQRPTAPTSWI
jgi:hypothetical protein